MNYSLRTDMKPSDIPQISRIWEERCGEGKANDDPIEAAYQSNMDDFGVIAEGSDSWTPDVVGFLLVRTYSPADVYTNFDRDDFDGSIGEKVGVVYILAVREHWEENGIGTDLLETAVQTARKNGYDSLVAVSWLRESTRDSSGLFRSQGFDEVILSEEYWYNLSQQRQTKCRECGDPPCTCDGLVFAKTLH